MLVNTVALDEYLTPIKYLLTDKAVNDILINQPGCAFIERNGVVFERHDIPDLTYHHLLGLTTLIARYTSQRLSDSEPLLSGPLPSGHRVQIILPPATLPGRVVICIRHLSIKNISLADYSDFGAFEGTRISTLKPVMPRDPLAEDKELNDLLDQGQMLEFISKAIMYKKNLLITGGTGTGKTTIINAALKAIPAHEHLMTIEDVPELMPTHDLQTRLFTSKGLQGVAKVTVQDLIQAGLRINPDRIILGEMRGAEALDFIHVTATGHDGSISSLHASSPSTAFMRMIHMMKLSGTSLSRDDLLADLQLVVDVIIQVKREVIGSTIKRRVSEIYFASRR